MSHSKQNRLRRARVGLFVVSAAAFIALGIGMSPLLRTLLAQVPGTINHQGVVAVNGVKFTGSGTFYFAIVSSGGQGVNVWTNDFSQIGTANRPSSGVTINVANGVYSAVLGGGTMTAIAPSHLASPGLVLRVWFNDGNSGVQQLSPDQTLTAAPFALSAAGVVPIGAIVAWHKNMDNCPPLIDNRFVECNGQVLSDPDSHFNGRQIPNLNGPRRFLRGSSHSGDEESDEVRSHSHGVRTGSYFLCHVPDGGSQGLPGNTGPGPVSSVSRHSRLWWG